VLLIMRPAVAIATACLVLLCWWQPLQLLGTAHGDLAAAGLAVLLCACVNNGQEQSRIRPAGKGEVHMSMHENRQHDSEGHVTAG
jgi:hypothetical protein